MRLHGLDADLLAHIECIDERCAGAVRAARGGADRLIPVGGRIQALRKSALGLARQVQELRRSRRHLDRGSLENEVSAQRQRLSAAADGEIRRETAVLLAAKERSLALLGELETAEARCVLRLEKIEAVLEGAALSMRGTQGQAAIAASAKEDDTLCRALDAEVDAVREVQQELVRCGRT
jgi:hypothetical protein